MGTIITDPQEIERVIDSLVGVIDVYNYGTASLEELRRLLVSGRQLRMKFNVDIAAGETNLRIEDAVNLWMYRNLQALGHKVVLLVSDFGARVGDVEELMEMEKKAATLIKQAKRILLIDPGLIEVCKDSTWYDRMRVGDLAAIVHQVTRDPDLIYPVLRAFNAVMLNIDLTIVGYNQYLIEMLGRRLQEKRGQTQQVVVATMVTEEIERRLREEFPWLE